MFFAFLLFFSICYLHGKCIFNKLLLQNYCARGETKLFYEQILSHTGQYDVKSEISISIGHFSTECRHNQKTKFIQSQRNKLSIRKAETCSRRQTRKAGAIKSRAFAFLLTRGIKIHHERISQTRSPYCQQKIRG